MLIARVGKKDSGMFLEDAPMFDWWDEIFNYIDLSNKKDIYINFIEGRLHPVDQRNMINNLKINYKEINIEFSTNSPYVIDELLYKDVKVYSNNKYKYLNEIEGFKEESYNGMLTTGELWDAYGEDWII